MKDNVLDYVCGARKKMDDYWDERAISYSDLIKNQIESPKKIAWETLIISNAPKEGNLKILDIGSGPGFFSIIMAQNGHIVTSVDYSNEMLKLAKENASQYCVHIDCILLSNDKLTFENETFDMVISRDVTWTLINPEETMTEWSRVLKKGGRMLYFDANWYYHLNNHNALKEYIENQKKIEAANMKVYSKANIMDSIAKSLPLSKEFRPDWDIKVLPKLGLKVIKVIDNVNPIVYREDEQLRYESKPEFMVVAEK